MQDTSKLYSFVIVDDEPIIRDGIRDNIPWSELGFRFSGACADGREAIELIEKTSPDVIMTDICMPFMDGIALSAWIRERLPSARIVVLTGFDDFEYAQKAVKLKVYDFILKPVTPRELKDVLLRLKRELDEERNVRQDIDRLREQLAESLPLLRDRLLFRLLSGDPGNIDAADRFEALKIPLPVRDAAYQVWLLDLDGHSGSESYGLDLMALENLTEKSLSGGYRHIRFQDSADRKVILAWSDRPQSLFRETLCEAESLLSSLSGIFSGRITVGIGETVSDISRVCRSYADALRSLSYGVFHGGGRIVTIRELAGKSGEEKDPPSNWGKPIAEALRTSSLSRVMELIDGMLGYYGSRGLLDEEYRASLQMVLASILQVVDDLEIPRKEILPGEPDPFSRIGTLKTREGVREWLGGLCAGIFECLSREQEKFSRSKVREAQAYIEERYADPGISLHSVCRDLSVSTSYFSLIFKKHTEKTFIEYLTDLRIRKAMELLKSTNMKTADIAVRVGYADSHYFSLIFRKTAGIPPTVYRSRYENETAGS